jgi:hypothetical protein
MIASGVGTGVAFEGKEWNATRLVKTRAVLTIMIAGFESFFIGVCPPRLLFSGGFTGTLSGS